MKRCTNCNAEYDDSQVFCKKCGVALVSGTPVNQTANAGMNVQPAAQEAGYKRWLGTIIAVIGLTVEWNLSALFGLIIVAAGFGQAYKSSNQGNKTVTTILLVIAIILYIITLAVL